MRKRGRDWSMVDFSFFFFFPRGSKGGRSSYIMVSGPDRDINNTIKPCASRTRRAHIDRKGFNTPVGTSPELGVLPSTSRPPARTRVMHRGGRRQRIYYAPGVINSPWVCGAGMYGILRVSCTANRSLGHTDFRIRPGRLYTQAYAKYIK